MPLLLAWHYTSRDKLRHRKSDKEMKDKLEKHEKNCFAFAAQRTEFPDGPKQPRIKTNRSDKM